MQSIVLFSALLIVFAHCGYPVPEYPVAGYPVPAYPHVPVALPHAVVEESEESGFFVEGGHTASEFRKRAKARTAQNRKFQRRPLQPIRRFKLKKQ